MGKFVKIKIKMVPGGPAGFALRRLATLGGAGRSFARLRKPIGTATSRLFSTTLRRKGGEDIARYRDYAPVNEGAFTTRYSEFIMFFAYWWFFHNLFYDPAHLYGDGMPDPRDWTDEELGIPED